MTVTVHSRGKWIILSRSRAVDLIHEVPRRNPFFKEELRGYRAEICEWLGDKTCDVLVVYRPPSLSFYRAALYRAVVRATRPRRGIARIIIYTETEEVIR